MKIEDENLLGPLGKYQPTGPTATAGPAQGIPPRPSPLPEWPPAGPQTGAPEPLWQPSPTDFRVGLLDRLFLHGNTSAQAAVWLKKTANAIFPWHHDKSGVDLDRAVQQLLAISPIGRAATIVLGDLEHDDLTMAEELIELDNARQLIGLQVTTKKNHGAFRAVPNGEPDYHATRLAAQAIRVVLTRNNLIKTSRDYLPFRKGLTQALDAAEDYLARQDPETVDSTESLPVIYTLSFLASLVAEIKNGQSDPSLRAVDLKLQSVGSALDLANLDDLPVTTTFFVAVLAVLKHTAQKPNAFKKSLAFVEKNSKLDFGIQRHTAEQKPVLEYLTDFLLDEQAPNGGIYESRLMTRLFIAVMQQLLRAKIGPHLKGRTVRAELAARHWLRESGTPIAELKSIYEVLANAKFSGKAQIEINREMGALRHQIARAELVEMAHRLNKQAGYERYEVHDERELVRWDKRRHCFVGVKDPHLSKKERHETRFVDIMILDTKTRRVHTSWEVTSGPGWTIDDRLLPYNKNVKGGPNIGPSKTAQLAKENRIRAKGDVYVLPFGTHKHQPDGTDYRQLMYRFPPEVQTRVRRIC